MSPEATEAMQVLIADHNPAVRSALRLLLEQEFEDCAVEDVRSLRDLLDCVQRSRPDLVMVDWDFLETGRRQTLAAIRAACSKAKIVALNAPPDRYPGGADAALDANISTREQPWRVLETLRGLEQLAPPDDSHSLDGPNAAS